MDKLRRRQDFLAAAKGVRAASACLTLQARQRGDEATARLGFTVTKKTGGAVERNRIRRRLRAVARTLQDTARPGFDYVIIARTAALGAPFEALSREVAGAFRRVHSPRDKTRSAPSPDTQPTRGKDDA